MPVARMLPLPTTTALPLQTHSCALVQRLQTVDRRAPANELILGVLNELKRERIRLLRGNFGEVNRGDDVGHDELLVSRGAIN